MSTQKTMLQNTKKALERLTELYPKCFVKGKDVKPLKIGILEDLFEQLDGDQFFSRRKLRMALRYYVYSKRYLKSVRKNVVRVDLQGQAAGNVSETQAQHAKMNLQLLDAKQQEKKSDKNSGSPHPEAW